MLAALHWGMTKATAETLNAITSRIIEAAIDMNNFPDR
jgi:hypothetical protein